MPLFRILTVPLEIRCRHDEDEPTLAELVEWLRDGGLEVGITAPFVDFIEHIDIDWGRVTESLGHPQEHENAGK